MALKFFPRESTSLHSFLKEYNFSLSFCTHPSLTSALGIAYFTPSHYIFAQQAGLFGDLYDVIVPEVQFQVNRHLRTFKRGRECKQVGMCLCIQIFWCKTELDQKVALKTLKNKETTSKDCCFEEMFPQKSL